MASLFERLKKFWQEMMEVEVEVSDQGDNREAKYVPIDEEQPTEFVSRQARQTSSTKARTKNIYPRNHNEQDLDEFMERTRPRFFRFPVVSDNELDKQRKTKRHLTDIASDKMPSQYQRNQQQKSEQGLRNSRESKSDADYLYMQQERMASESEDRQKWKESSLERPITDSYTQRGQQMDTDPRYSSRSPQSAHHDGNIASLTPQDDYNQPELYRPKKPFTPTEIFSPIYGKIKEGDSTVKNEQVRQARINEDGQIVIVKVGESIQGEKQQQEQENAEVDSWREQAAAAAAQRLQEARRGRMTEQSARELTKRTEPEATEAVKPEAVEQAELHNLVVANGQVDSEQQGQNSIIQHHLRDQHDTGNTMLQEDQVHGSSIADEEIKMGANKPILPIPFSYVATKMENTLDETQIDGIEQVKPAEELKSASTYSVQAEESVPQPVQPTEPVQYAQLTQSAPPLHTTNQWEKPASTQEELSEQLPVYEFPTISLLTPTVALTEDDYEHTLEQKRLLEETLSNFNVNANVVNIVKGPSVTRFELQPAPGVKVNKITSLSDDIKLNLAAKDIRIEAPIPGRNAVGIEVPNIKSEPIFIRRILESDKFKNHPSPLAIALGMDIGGEPIVADIKKMPHGLVAGSTGSGKSVCINSIIISLLFKSTPEQVRLLLIDPKMVELAPYNNLPHLVTPVVTDAKQATASLKWAVEEMEKRYTLFVEAGVRDIERYNQTTDDQLPYIVIIIDELADLMMVSPQDVEDCIIRIAQKARACGIHLLLATQRPSVDIITGNIKANVPTRLAFAVFSQIDSRTILDQSGAERLLGRGDMLFLESGTAPIRLQGNYVNDDEIDAVTSVIKKQRKPEYIFTREELEAQVSSIEMGDDPLFHEALVFVAEQAQASASSLQRRFRIGYNRAARLIEMMEASGYVAGQNGGKPRTVLITAEDAQALGEGSSLF
ncbi:DNA translocase FtsK [Brevibacterium sp. JNUCC-42]|nr:DNA translocase FtsK [Brevibacterium sp. JNUCC-42]